MEFKIYYSKQNNMPCIEFNDQVLITKNIECKATVQGSYQEEESPSWVLTGEADRIIVKKEGVFII